MVDGPGVSAPAGVEDLHQRRYAEAAWVREEPCAVGTERSA